MISHGVEILLAGCVEEIVPAKRLGPFFFFFLFFFIPCVHGF